MKFDVFDASAPPESEIRVLWSGRIGGWPVLWQSTGGEEPTLLCNQMQILPWTPFYCT
jgi:hypothetical protein